MRILFVCLGNICRSPTAQGVFEHTLSGSTLADKVSVDSAGTGDWHVGKAPDPRATAEASRRGIDISGLRARQVRAQDFADFDMIIAMDRQNLHDLKAMAPKDGRASLHLFLDFATDARDEVPDPYYGGEDGFRDVFDLVTDASEGLIKVLAEKV